MDLNRLEEFLIVAQTGTFKEAAKKLGLPANVLSTRIRRFEEDAGVSLFRHTRNGVVLTETGQLLLSQAPQLLKSWNYAAGTVAELKNHRFQSLHLQLCSHTMAGELGPYLDIFCRRHPQMLLDLYDENTCSIRSGLKSGKVDIAFVMCRRHDFSDIPGRMALSYFPNLYIHLPLDHRLSGSKQVHFSDLQNETFILYPRMLESWTRDLQVSLIEQSGINYNVYEENCSPFYFDLLVPIGKGIRLWNWGHDMAPNSQILPIADRGYDTYLYMLYDPDTANPAVIPFINGFMEFRKERK